jgi:hypothetical protein
MITTRAVAIVVLGLILSTQAPQAQERARYRDFTLGSDLRSVSALTKVAASDAKTIHQRPAEMLVLEWRPSSTLRQNDPVQQIVFSFYNDQLSKMVVDYDRERTAGMTDTDMIEAISTAYGPPLTPAVKTRAGVSQVGEESGTPVAQWGDTDYSVVLARTADAEAIRLDQREAPQRELARQKKEVDDTRVSQEKARLANKAAFRP